MRTLEVFNTATLGASVGIVGTICVLVIMLALFGGGRK